MKSLRWGIMSALPSMATFCVDLQDPEGALQGLVAFQLHSGGPMEVRFRRLSLEVDPEPKLTTTLSDM